MSIYPDLVRSVTSYGVFKKALAANLLKLEIINLRDYDPQGTVDGKPYGGGDSMIMRADVLARTIRSDDLIISTSPKADQYFDQSQAEWLKQQLSHKNITLICGRFGGIDVRFERRYVHHLYSFGDFVCSGGELPCLMMAESIIRLIPRVLSNPISTAEDSFGRNLPNTLEYPLYTKPRVFEGESVPHELTSGDHKLIQTWKQQFTRPKPPRTKR